jgi:hypothetical protein
MCVQIDFLNITLVVQYDWRQFKRF